MAGASSELNKRICGGREGSESESEREVGDSGTDCTRIRQDRTGLEHGGLSQNSTYIVFVQNRNPESIQ